ncbi:DUF3822 family protein [Cryomorphaceae bacterium 1068]|nr:DUF3822 family protein [Cryomorphaceae bacterium 1068]
MEKITLGEEHFETIGLLFEPNFFQIYCYSDLEGDVFVKTISCKRNGQYDFSELKSKNHLFALSSQPHWTIVPTAVFREEDARGYLELTTGFEGKSLFSHSTLEGLESVLIYERDTEAEKLLSQIQPALEVKHLAGTLLEHGRRKVSESKGDLLQIQVLDQLALVTIFRQGSLLLANCIEINKSEDLIYYTFYTLKKLDISTEIRTEISGSGTIFSSVKKQAAKFLTNLNDSGKDSVSDQLAVIIAQCA